LVAARGVVCEFEAPLNADGASALPAMKCRREIPFVIDPPDLIECAILGLATLTLD
jgi:hypothetical protein